MSSSPHASNPGCPALCFCSCQILLEQDEVFKKKNSVTKAERCEHGYFLLPGPHSGGLAVSVGHDGTCWTSRDRARVGPAWAWECVSGETAD